MEYYDELSKLFESEDADLFKPKPKKHIASADDHLIDSFQKITLFVRNYGRLPDPSADDINEAALAVSLNTIRSDKTKSSVLEDYDELGLLELDKAPESLEELFSEDSGLFGDDKGIFDISKLPESKRVVEYGGDKATREPVGDFDGKFKHWFVDQQTKLASGERKLTPFHDIEQLQPGQFYVYDGMMCHVLSFGEKERKLGGYSQQRIHVIFENGTQSNMYRRSLAQRLYEGGTVVVDAAYSIEKVGQAVGRIYILQSLSEDPKVQLIKDLYKIGVTTSSVSDRIRNAHTDPTYLMAPVKIVEDYRLTGDYNPQKVEALIHKVFGSAKVDVEITDKSGMKYIPSEWYSVPLHVIIEMIDMIDSGEIINYFYDPQTQTLKSIN